MKTPVSQLTNAQLDRLCAELQDWELLPVQHNYCEQAWKNEIGEVILVSQYHPTINGAQFAELLEKYKIELKHYAPDIGWNAYCSVNACNGFGRGETASLAGCRAFVDAMTGGNGVEIEL